MNILRYYLAQRKMRWAVRQWARMRPNQRVFIQLAPHTRRIARTRRKAQALLDAALGNDPFRLGVKLDTSEARIIVGELPPELTSRDR